MVSQAQKLKPLKEVFQQASSADLEISEKLWEQLRSAQLIEPAIRMPQSRRYGITMTQERRLRRILAVRKQLHGRFTVGKLVYELAMRGDRQISALHFQREVKRRLTGVFGFMRRGMARWLHLPIDPNRVSDKQLYIAARRISKRLTQGMAGDPRAPVHRQAIELVAITVLRMFYRTASSLEMTRSLKEVLPDYVGYYSPKTGFVGARNQSAAALQIATLFSTVHRWLTFDRKNNELLDAIDKISPEGLVACVRDSQRLQRALVTGLKGLATHLPSGAASFVQQLLSRDENVEVLGLLCLATLITVRDSESASPMLRDLKRRKTMKITIVMTSIQNLVDIISRLEGVRHARRATDFG